MIEEEQTTQASETADNQSLLAVSKDEEVAAEIEVPHRELNKLKNLILQRNH